MFYLAQLVEKRRTLYSLIRAEALAYLILGADRVHGVDLRWASADMASFAGLRNDKQAREIRRVCYPPAFLGLFRWAGGCDAQLSSRGKS